MMEQPLRGVKVIVAKLGLDTHWKGAIIVSYILKNAGADVIYIGNSMPEDIINTVIDEDPHVVGVSSLGGAHLSLGSKLIEQAKKEGVFDERLYVMGGVIPPQDIPTLYQLGFSLVFGPGTTENDIITAITKKLKEKNIGL
jgi:methylmalonyl-CoA mutase C-terminal domain/subunit